MSQNNQKQKEILQTRPNRSQNFKIPHRCRARRNAQWSHNGRFIYIQKPSLYSIRTAKYQPL
jgi:hypothetical protein